MVDYLGYLAILVAWVLKVNNEKLGKNNNNNALKKGVLNIFSNVILLNHCDSAAN